MTPKKDNQTSTVEGAEAFERYHNAERDEPDLPDEERDEIQEERDENYCGCSDPWCPCGG